MSAKKEYPMTYEEYEKRVVDLYIELYPKDKQEEGMERLNGLLKSDPEFIEGLYEDTCFVMTTPKYMVTHANKCSMIIF